jgi:hypothetical protein
MLGEHFYLLVLCWCKPKLRNFDEDAVRNSRRFRYFFGEENWKILRRRNKRAAKNIRRLMAAMSREIATGKRKGRKN